MVESISSPSAIDRLDEAIAYCAEQLRLFDRDSYTICATTERFARQALFALFAFNLEVAKICEIVSEPMLGQIRLQWWREAIAGIYIGKPAAHAVVRALADAVERGNLSRVRFDRLIDAREFDLEDRQPNTVEDLMVYADATSGELTSLTLEMLGACDDITLTKGRHAGIVWALNGLLRAIPFHAAQRRCFLPKSLTDKYDISIDKLYEGNPDNNLVHAVLELATVAAHHLVQAQDDRYEMEINARPAFSCLAVVAADLKKLQKADFDVYSVLPMGPLRRRWLFSTAISWRNLIGRV